jgi:hypothetical protein
MINNIFNITLVVTVFLMDINDILRPAWFYDDIWSLLFWNCFAYLGLIMIYIEHKEMKKDDN